MPVHVEYCGNTNYLDNTHIWVGGGCGPFESGVLGAVFTIDPAKGNVLTEIGQMRAAGFNYTYRADLL